MVFKTWLSDINKVALAMDGLKGIKIVGTIDKLNTKSLNAFIKGIDGLTLSQAQATLSTKALTDKQKEQILVSVGLLKTTNSVTASEIKQTVSEDILTTTKQQEILATFELEMSEGKLNLERLEAIALEDTEVGAIARVILAKKKENAENLKNIASGKSLLKVLKGQLATLASNPLTWAIGAFAGITAVALKSAEAIEKVREKASELGDEFNTSKSDVDGYKTQIEDLYKTINDSNSSVEDITTARQTLMTVQDELINKFGKEKETIDLVTDAINGQSSALDILTQKKWQETKNKFNENDFWTNVGNWSQGYESNIDRMVDEMENPVVRIGMSINDFESGEYTEVIQQMEKLGWTYSKTLSAFTKDGSLEDLYEEILNIQNIVDENAPAHFLEELTTEANKAKTTLDSYGSMWDNYILNDKIFADDNLVDSWKEVSDAYTKYQNAVASGDKTAIEEATSGFATSINEVLNDENVSDSVKDYFKDMYPAIYREVEKWEFKTNIIPEFHNVEVLQGKTKSDILEILQTDGFQSGEGVFNAILKSATDYGLVVGEDSERIEQLLDLLVQWGILQEGITDEIQNSNKSTVWTFSEDQIKALDTYKSNINQISEAIADIPSLNSSDITSLMTDFSQYSHVFEQFGVTGQKGVGDLEGALRRIAELMLSVAENECPQLALAIKAIFDEAFFDGDKITQLEIELEELDKCILSMKQGKSLDAVATSKLINKYDELNAAVIITEEGYQLELETLEKLRDAKVESANTAIAKQIEETQNAIDQAKARIESYKTEQEAVNELTKTYTNAKFTTFEDYLSANSYIEDALAEEMLGADGYAKYLEGGMASAKLAASEERLDELMGKLKNLGGSSSKSNSSEPTVFDWIETRIESTEKEIDGLNEKLEAVSNFTSQNPLIDEMLSSYQKELSALDEAKKKYMEYADAVDLSASYIEKIQNGTLAIEKVSNETTKKKINEYKQWYDKAQDVESSIQDIIKKTKELNRQRLDNIINDYDRVTSLADSYKDYYQALLDVKEAKGKAVDESDYNSLIQKELDIQATLLEQYKVMEREIKNQNLSPSDDDYYENQKELVNLKLKIEDCTSAVEGFKDSILEIRWSNFETGMALLDDLSDEISDVTTLLGDGDIFKDGEITDLGMTKLGLYAQQYVTAKKQIAEYENAISKVEEMYRNGIYSQEEYNQKLIEFRQASRDAALSVKDMREEILQFHRESIEAQLEDKRKTIDAIKEQLDEEKALGDYRESVLEKQKGIQSLEKKIATLRLSDAREDIALRLQLEEQLEEARKELEKQEYEHSIDNQKNALDEEYENFEKEKNEELDELENNLDKQDALIEEYLDDVQNNYDVVYDNIQNISEKFGIKFTESLTSPWESATSAAELYAQVVGDVMSQIQINSASIGVGMTGTSMGNGNTGNWIQTNDGRWRYMQSDGEYKKNDWLEDFGNRWYSFDSEGYMHENQWIDTNEGKYYVGQNGAMCTGWNEINGNDYYFDEHGRLLKEGYTPDGYYVDGEGVWNGGAQVLDDELIKQNLAHYAKGTLSVPHNQLAVFDEHGKEEIIVHADQGGKVGVLTKGSSVIPADISSKLIAMANGFDWTGNLNLPKIPDYSQIPISSRNAQVVNLNVTSPLMEVYGGLDTSIMKEVDRKISKIPDDFRRYMKDAGVIR